MSSHQPSIPHEIRTFTQPRQHELYSVRISQIERVNSAIRLFQLAILSEESSNNSQSSPDLENKPFGFYPGQWLDVYIPSIQHAGGFTITSSPREANPQYSSKPYLELAVQCSPSNPAAAWLWQSEGNLIGAVLRVRVGGSFVWPPPAIGTELLLSEVRKIVFVAGGVGINPLISMLSHIHANRSDLHPSTKIHFLYSTKLFPTADDPGSTRDLLSGVLFLTRLHEVVRSEKERGVVWPLDVRLYLTNTSSFPDNSSLDISTDLKNDVSMYERRITPADLHNIIGSDGYETSKAVCNVCGPPKMTDEFVEVLKGLLGGGRVFYEKWW